MIIKYRELLSFNRFKKDIASETYYHHPIHDEIINISKKHNINNFIETGTYMGNTIFAVKDIFRYIYSIELSKKIFNLVKNRFSSYNNIKILNGDSADILSEIIPNIDGPTLFWLDAHYSSGATAKGIKYTPIFEELSIIFNAKYKHIILIDAMKDFNGENDYPTIKELEMFIKNNSDYICEIKNGVAYLYKGTL